MSKRRYHHSILTVYLTAAIALAFSLPARATPPPEAPGVFFAKKVGEALGRSIDLNTLKGGLPEVIVALVHKRYSQPSMASARSAYLKNFEAAATEFAGQWAKYAKKKEAVGSALTRAAAATPKEAVSILKSILSPPPRNDRGFIKRKREFVDPCDAEVEAVLALAKVLGQQKSYHDLVELSANLMGCRQVSNKSEELLLWFATRTEREFSGLKFGQEAAIGEAINRVLEEAYNLRGRRGQPQHRQLAQTFFHSLPTFGLQPIRLGDYKRVKRGAWILMQEIYQPSLKKKSLRYVYNRTFQEAYDCKYTNKIVGYNTITHKWDYEYRCKERPVKVKASVAAALVQSPPDWTKNIDRFNSIWVIGQVAKLGPAWKLRRAQIADLRFLKWREPRW